MTHSTFRRVMLALTFAFATFVIGAAFALPANARPVALSDATVAPTFLAYLRAGDAITVADRFGYNCHHGRHRGYFSDVSAYRWNGRALHSQRWDSVALQFYWRDHDDFAVTFDGARFFNDTMRSVIVAGWCE